MTLVQDLRRADIADWRKAAEPLRDKTWAENVKKAGYDPKKVFDDLNAELKARNSLYE
jgi:hypothetical protein